MTWSHSLSEDIAEVFLDSQRLLLTRAADLYARRAPCTYNPRSHSPVRCYCGAVFVPLNMRRIYCSQGCGWRARQTREVMARLPRREARQCRNVRCGAVFVPLKLCTRFCTDDCQRTWRRVKHHVRRECRNPKCAAWFVQTHALQRYCCKRCALLTAKRNYELREATEPDKRKRRSDRWRRHTIQRRKRKL